MSQNPSNSSPSAETPPELPQDQAEADALLPNWAHEVPRRRRFISRRNILIAVVGVLALGIVVWLNFPFIPDPIKLARQPNAAIGSASSGDNWTMAGRNLGQTGFVADVLSEPTGTLAWSVDLGPPTLAAPVVADGRIYAGGHFRIIVLDSDTGAELESMPATGPIGNSLALADGTLYYSMPDRRLVARDAASQEIRWEYEMSDSTGGPVSVANGIVYAGALDGITYAVNATNGELIWRHDTLGEARSPATVTGKIAHVASADRSLYALDARTGQERARFRTSAALVAAPVTANGLTYFVSGRQLYAMESDALEYPGQYAVTRTWSQLWLWGFPLPSPPSQPGDRWRVGPDYPEGTSSREKRTEGIISAPAVAGDRLYIGDTLGKLYGVDAITGEEQWQFQAEDGIVASPVAVGDLVAFGDKSGWFYGLNRHDGTEIWRLQLSDSIRVSPVYAEGRLLVRTEDGQLHSIQ
jgi:outer membrane protein assembly factor BamB